MQIDLDQLRETLCIGVAGNFAGHLEQAGEARDFINVTAAQHMPKGIFPWYVPGNETFLGTFPLSHDVLTVPNQLSTEHHIQIEPELGVMCDIVRDHAGGHVSELIPRWLTAFDDCSWRRPDAERISQKKNWGAGSKGIAQRALAIDDLDASGALAHLRVACFLLRDGELHAYGVDSAAASYSLAGNELLTWIIDRLANQTAIAGQPLEDVGALLRARPEISTLFIGIGATRYEKFGEHNFVAAGDQAIVAVYDSHEHAAQ
jgi:hypothetical protein